MDVSVWNWKYSFEIRLYVAADTFSTGCDTDKKIWPVTYGNNPSTVTGHLYGYHYDVDADHYMVLCGIITSSTLSTGSYNYVMV